MDTIIYIIVASLTIGGVVGRMTSLREVSTLTKKTEEDKEAWNKAVGELKEQQSEVFERIGFVERSIVRIETQLDNLMKAVERLQK